VDVTRARARPSAQGSSCRAGLCPAQHGVTPRGHTAKGISSEIYNLATIPKHAAGTLALVTHALLTGRVQDSFGGSELSILIGGLHDSHTPAGRARRLRVMLKTRPEYVWLGDYPKEAERRKQGYTLPAGVK